MSFPGAPQGIQQFDESVLLDWSTLLEHTQLENFEECAENVQEQVNLCLKYLQVVIEPYLSTQTKGAGQALISLKADLRDPRADETSLLVDSVRWMKAYLPLFNPATDENLIYIGIKIALKIADTIKERGLSRK